MDDHLSVLVIDDDGDIRETLREVIAAEGFPVIAVANGAQGLDQLVTGARPGLIVLDLMMPVMNGWEFLSELRKNDAFADVPVAVISASGGRPPAARATAAIRKPIDLDALIALVRRHCAAPPAVRRRPSGAKIPAVRLVGSEG